MGLEKYKIMFPNAKLCDEFTDTHKNLISKYHSGKKLSEEHRRHIGESVRGRRVWNSGKTMMDDPRIAKLGWARGLTKETDLRVLQGALHQTGRKCTEESKKLISARVRGRVVSDETKKKISEAKLGKSFTLEHRKHISDVRKLLSSWNKGIPWSQEVKDKIRAKRLEQVIPFYDTSIEVKLQQALNQHNVGFLTHVRLFGQPDIFIDPNICIFADGDYWHSRFGKPERDARVNEVLETQGYEVLRFREHEINSNLDGCIATILLTRILSDDM